MFLNKQQANSLFDIMEIKTNVLRNASTVCDCQHVPIIPVDVSTAGRNHHLLGTGNATYFLQSYEFFGIIIVYTEFV